VATIKIIGEFDEFFVDNRDKEILVSYGGAGSGKSFSTAQHTILRALEENNKRILITRKTLPALRVSCLQLIKDLLSEYEIPYELNKSELEMKVGNNQILFKSLIILKKLKARSLTIFGLRKLLN
jgi:phage terminase large subunit